MKHGTLKSLEYFVKRVCTIFVTDMPKHFTHQQFNDYFVGLVESIDLDGVVTIHPVTGCKNFFPYSHIVGISEEQMLDPSKPADAELIKEIKEKGIQPSMEMKVDESQFADIDIMADLARQAKEMEKKK
jgi:cyclopropane fatty-acyl-phospholipid synthase-like methyltransferase